MSLLASSLEEDVGLSTALVVAQAVPVVVTLTSTSAAVVIHAAARTVVLVFALVDVARSK